MTHAFESGFFTRIAAWHRLGTVVQEAPTTEDAIRLAGLDWQVEERPIAHLSPELVGTTINTHKAIVRSSDNRCLGVVGQSYAPLQNLHAFKFFDAMLQSRQATLDAAGSLRGGQRIWILAKLRGASAEVLPGDRVEGYLLLSNSHDGSAAVRVQFTTTRVVCWNTLSFVHRKGDARNEDCLRVRHTANIIESMDAVRRVMDLNNRTFSLSVEAYQALARKQISVAGLREYVREVFCYDGTPNPDAMPKCWPYIEQSFDSGVGADIVGVRGTYWGAWNAVTDFVGHVRGKDESRRLDSVWFGHGKAVIEHALGVALAAVN